MLQKPRHLPASLYVAGKGFVLGVAVGLSGVVVNPVRGEQIWVEIVLSQSTVSNYLEHNSKRGGPPLNNTVNGTL